MSKKVPSEVPTSPVPAATKTSLSARDEDLVRSEVATESKRSPRSRRSARQSAAETEGPADDEIKAFLHSHNFKVTERVVSADDENEGKLRCVLYKVVNCLGQTAFVKVDAVKSKRVHVSRKDLTVVRIDEVTTIDESLKEGSYKCAGSDVNGIVLLGANAICMMTYDKDPNEPEETSFVYITENHDREAILGDDPVAYPVVLLEEIEANCRQVNINIYEVTNRIREKIHKTSMYDLCDMAEDSKSMKMEISKLYGNFGSTVDCIKEKVDKTIMNLQRLECYQKFYVENPPTDEIEAEKMKAISRLLCCWNEMIVEELKCIKAINNQREHVCKAAEHIARTEAYLTARYNRVMAEMSKVCPRE